MARRSLFDRDETLPDKFRSVLSLGLKNSASVLTSTFYPSNPLYLVCVTFGFGASLNFQHGNTCVGPISTPCPPTLKPLFLEQIKSDQKKLSHAYTRDSALSNEYRQSLLPCREMGGPNRFFPLIHRTSTNYVQQLVTA